jgi:hypothetical protein
MGYPTSPAHISVNSATGSALTLAWPTEGFAAIYTCTLAANTVFSLAAAPTGYPNARAFRIELRVQNDSTGTYTATLPTPWGGWSGVSAPTPPSGANAIGRYFFDLDPVLGVLGSY